MRDSIPDYNLFDNEAKQTFSFLTKDFGYKLIDVVSKPNYVRHIYRNRLRRRKIIIENQTWPVDYGFSFVVHNLWTTENYILYNIPWEKEDKRCVFLNRVKDRVSNSEYFKSIIQGRTWKLKRNEFVYE